MRQLVICITLSALLWLTAQPTPPSLLTLVGLITMTGLVFTNFFRRLKLPGLLGALCAGLALGQTPLITSQALSQTHHVQDFALAWVGLFMSAGLTPSILTNKRLCKSALSLFIPPFAFTLLFLFFHPLPLSTALPIALLTSTPMTLFLIPNSRMKGEIVPLGKLMTFLGLLLWMGLSLNPKVLFDARPLQDVILDVIIYFILIEACVQICKATKTETAQHIALLTLAYFIAFASFHREISALFLAFPAGVLLSLRGVHLPFLHAQSLAETILTFALTAFALEISHNSPPLTAYQQFPTLFFFLFVFVGGKVIGGGIAQYFFDISPKAWLALLPQGLFAFICLNIYPTPIFAPTGTLHLAVFLPLVALSFIYPVYMMVWRAIKKDPQDSHRHTRRVLS